MVVLSKPECIVGRTAILEEDWAERDDQNQCVWETVPILSVGVHPGNRGGIYTQGQTVKGLYDNIIRNGFHEDEADSLGVAVRERPQNMQGNDEESILAFNIKQTKDDRFLAGAYDERHTIKFGVLANSHLLNVCRCILTSRQWDGTKLSHIVLAAHPNGFAS